MKQISMEQMKCLNKLSGFCLSTEALLQEKNALEELLACFEVLHGLDTQNISHTEYLFPKENALREDIPIQECSREAVIRNAPSLKDGAFVVPATRERQESQ